MKRKFNYFSFISQSYAQWSSLKDVSERISQTKKFANMNDLPTELLLDIYGDLSLDDLVNVAKSMPRNEAAARTIFRDKYGTSKFVIRGVRLFDNRNFFISEDVIFLCKSDFTREVLRLFGPLISILKAELTYSVDERHNLYEDINEYCAKTLLDFEVDNAGLDLLVGPFLRAENVTIDYGFFSKENIRIESIFPTVRRFDVGNIEGSPSSTWFEHNFPNLEHLIIKSFFTINPMKLQKMLQANQQIRSVSIADCMDAHLDIINANLPTLESIEILNYVDFGPHTESVIHFEHLKKFKIAGEYMYPLMHDAPLKFSNLEEFECVGPIDNWFDNILENKRLKKMLIGPVDRQQLTRIQQELPNLEELSTYFDTTDSTNFVIDFLNEATNLRRISFDEIDDETRTVIPKNWTVIVEKYQSVVVKNDDLK